MGNKVINNRENALSNMKMGKLIFKLSMPAVIAQIVNVLYNIVDRMYIGHIPEDGIYALTGLGICFPILMLISSLSALIGYGGAPIAAIELGKGNREQAEKIIGNCTTAIFFVSIFIMIILQPFKTPILFAFGASNNTIEFASSYLQIYLYGTLFVQISIGLNIFISSQGESKTAMFSVLIGTILNIILDPIFIFVLKMGVKGAALATVLSQLVSTIWIMKFLTGPNTSIKIRTKNLKLNKKIMLSILALGVSPFIMQSTESLVTIVLNTGLQKWGNDLYVGSMTIMTTILLFSQSPISGFANGSQPIMSYNYGAGNNNRVIECFKKLCIVCFTFTLITVLIICFFPVVFIKIFTDDNNLIELASKFLPIFMGGYWLFGAQIAVQSLFVGLNKPKHSLFIALFRKIGMLIPLALILPNFFGVKGIFWSEPIADTISALTAFIICIVFLKKEIRVDTIKPKQ